MATSTHFIELLSMWILDYLYLAAVQSDHDHQHTSILYCYASSAIPSINQQ